MKNEEAKEAKKESLKENLRDISVQIDRLFITVMIETELDIKLKRLEAQYSNQELQLSKEKE